MSDKANEVGRPRLAVLGHTLIGATMFGCMSLMAISTCHVLANIGDGRLRSQISLRNIADQFQATGRSRT